MLLVRKRNSLAGSAIPGVSPSTPAQAPAQPDIPQRYRIRREWVRSQLRTLRPHIKAFSGGAHQELTPLWQCPPWGEALTALGPDKPCRKGTRPTPEQRKDGKRSPGTRSRHGAPVPAQQRGARGLRFRTAQQLCLPPRAAPAAFPAPAHPSPRPQPFPPSGGRTRSSVSVRIAHTRSSALDLFFNSVVSHRAQPGGLQGARSPGVQAETLKFHILSGRTVHPGAAPRHHAQEVKQFYHLCVI